MRNRLVIAIGLVIAVLMATAALSPVDAGPGHRGRPAKADGIWCYTPDFDRLDAALDIDRTVPADEQEDAYTGSKVFGITYEDAEWTGVFEGFSRDYGTFTIADPALPPTLFMATVVFDEVEVRGRVGAMELDVHGGRPDGTADWEGQFYITDASGELEGLEGHGSWWGPGFIVGKTEDCGVIYYDVERLTGLGRGRR
jgi:hypothetical protein